MEYHDITFNELLRMNDMGINEEEYSYNLIIKLINVFIKEIEENIFININEYCLIERCNKLISLKKISLKTKNEYNKFIEYLINIENKTKITYINLHDTIINKNMYDYIDDSGKPHILLRPELERQMYYNEYNEELREHELCKLLLNIKKYLRSEFLYREYYLNCIITEYKDIKHQIIKLELTRYKQHFKPIYDIGIIILLDELRLRFYKITNEINGMLNYIRNLNYIPASNLYKNYMYNLSSSPSCNAIRLSNGQEIPVDSPQCHGSMKHGSFMY